MSLTRSAGDEAAASFSTCCARMEETGSLVTHVPRLKGLVLDPMLSRSELVERAKDQDLRAAPGAELERVVDFQQTRRHLPIVTLRKAA